jgi:hypothetical protein
MLNMQFIVYFIYMSIQAHIRYTHCNFHNLWVQSHQISHSGYSSSLQLLLSLFITLFSKGSVRVFIVHCVIECCLLHSNQLPHPLLCLR